MSGNSIRRSASIFITVNAYLFSGSKLHLVGTLDRLSIDFLISFFFNASEKTILKNYIKTVENRLLLLLFIY